MWRSCKLAIRCQIKFYLSATFPRGKYAVKVSAHGGNKSATFRALSALRGESSDGSLLFFKFHCNIKGITPIWSGWTLLYKYKEFVLGWNLIKSRRAERRAQWNPGGTQHATYKPELTSNQFCLNITSQCRRNLIWVDGAFKQVPRLITTGNFRSNWIRRQKFSGREWVRETEMRFLSSYDKMQLQYDRSTI